jgi:MSHA biogenesis protein MshJ
MKQQWTWIASRIDALSLRERGMAFAAAASIVTALIYSFLLGPQFDKQKDLSQKLSQEQSKIAALQAEIQMKANEQSIDPDAATRLEMQKLKLQSAQMHRDILNMQKGLVSPDKMAALLGDIVKQHGKLRLVSLKTLPVVSVSDANNDKKTEEKSAEAEGDAAPEGSEGATPAVAVYRHSVEIKIQGEYLDMVAYMAQLEAMPWQLLWGKVNLTVEDYPKANLTLTLFTLSLNKKWLSI